MADEQKAPRTKEEFNRQMAELQLKRAELENRKLERDIQNMDLAEQNLATKAKRNGETLAATNASGQAKIAGCNHKKGGKELAGYRGRGDGKVGGYAIVMHMFPNADIGVFCLRCPKIWLPPVLPKEKECNSKAEYTLAMKEYEKLLAEYRWALALPTDNEMSTSGLFRGGNFDANCREALQLAAAHPQDS